MQQLGPIWFQRAELLQAQSLFINAYRLYVGAQASENGVHVRESGIFHDNGIPGIEYRITHQVQILYRTTQNNKQNRSQILKIT